ncbi:MAG: hypothetical protein Kow0089_16810 [Desulfobulbaceae bacterium]
MSEQMQPTGTEQEKTGGTGQDPVLDNPARADYREGRELFSRGEYGAAAMAYHNALRGFEEQGDEQGVANCSDRLGDVCVAREEYALALDHYRRAYAICEKEHDIFSMTSLNRKIAGVYKRTGELDKALALLFEIFDHYSQLRDPKGTVEILEVIAEVYQDRGDRVKAADALRTIASIHRNFKHTRQAAQFEQRAAALEQEE